ncbi:MAG: hypothetical protein ACTS5I_10120, partial [Rhodanobacter sp.]
MTIADSRVVAWHTDDFATDKSATTYDKVVAARWIAKGWPVTSLVHESLLAEAERIAAIRLDAMKIQAEDNSTLTTTYEKVKSERDTLQSRLDAVGRLTTELVALAKHHEIKADRPGTRSSD